MKEALDFCVPMSHVGNDFVDHLKSVRQENNEIVGLEKELFKWAFECKFISTNIIMQP
jgi:cytochrome P450 family 49 subfamily A